MSRALKLVRKVLEGAAKQDGKAENIVTLFFQSVSYPKVFIVTSKVGFWLCQWSTLCYRNFFLYWPVFARVIRSFLTFTSSMLFQYTDGALVSNEEKQDLNSKLVIFPPIFPLDLLE